MKKLFVYIFLLIVSSNSFSYTVFDNPSDVSNILKAAKEWNIPLVIPSDLRFNNSNQRVSPGEIVIIEIENSDKREEIQCELHDSEALKSYLLSSPYFSVKDCFRQKYDDKCLVEASQLSINSNKIVLAVNKFVPPGSELICESESGSLNFNVTILD
jgi:hypothetical protein